MGDLVTSVDQLSSLMRQAGFLSLRPEAQMPAGAGGGAWFLPLSDVRVDALHDGARGRLVLSADVGRPLPWHRNELFELMLQYNDHCEDTGMRLGIEELDDEENVVLVMDLPLTWLPGGGLARAFFALLEVRGSWHRIVERDASKGHVPFVPLGLARRDPSAPIHV